MNHRLEETISKKYIIRRILLKSYQTALKNWLRLKDWLRFLAKEYKQVCI